MPGKRPCPRIPAPACLPAPPRGAGGVPALSPVALSAGHMVAVLRQGWETQCEATPEASLGPEGTGPGGGFVLPTCVGRGPGVWAPQPVLAFGPLSSWVKMGSALQGFFMPRPGRPPGARGRSGALRAGSRAPACPACPSPGALPGQGNCGKCKPHASGSFITNAHGSPPRPKTQAAHAHVG